MLSRVCAFARVFSTFLAASSPGHAWPRPAEQAVDQQGESAGSGCLDRPGFAKPGIGRHSICGHGHAPHHDTDVRRVLPTVHPFARTTPDHLTCRPLGQEQSRPLRWPAGRLSPVRPRIENLSMVRLREYYQDPSTPTAHDVLPAAFAAVRNSAGQLLLVRRIDDGNWELPGGRIEVGESAGHTVVREVAEESGITIELTGLAGVYSDPTHVLVDPDDTIHQQLALCFHAVPTHPPTATKPAPMTSKPTLPHGQHHRNRRPQDASGDATTDRQCPPRAAALLLRLNNTFRFSARHDISDSFKKRDRPVPPENRARNCWPLHAAGAPAGPQQRAASLSSPTCTGSGSGRGRTRPRGSSAHLGHRPLHPRPVLGCRTRAGRSRTRAPGRARGRRRSTAECWPMACRSVRPEAARCSHRRSSAPPSASPKACRVMQRALRPARHIISSTCGNVVWRAYIEEHYATLDHG